MKMSQDEKWMALAVSLAEKGRARVSPNPMVGACVVKGNKLISSGYHRVFGSAHAEVNALKKAGVKAKGATLYVTLEPCSSWGKTGPCSEAVIQAGVKKVVIGVLDPNPMNARKGVRALKKAGIQVKTGVLKNEIKLQNETFFKHMKTRMPFVTLKMAQTLDGKIATASGKSRWITSKGSREFVHRLRLDNDAVMVGKNTLLKDNPLLSPRLKTLDSKKPWRVVLDPNHEIPAKARVLSGKQVTLVVISEKKLGKRKIKKNERKQIILPVKEKKGKLDLRDLMYKLGAFGVGRLLVEGGGELAWSLLNEGLVDKACWIIAPKFIGGRNAISSVEGQGIENLNKPIRFSEAQVSQLGEDLLYEARF